MSIWALTENPGYSKLQDFWCKLLMNSSSIHQNWPIDQLTTQHWPDQHRQRRVQQTCDEHRAASPPHREHRTSEADYFPVPRYKQRHLNYKAVQWRILSLLARPTLSCTKYPFGLEILSAVASPQPHHNITEIGVSRKAPKKERSLVEGTSSFTAYSVKSKFIDM